MKLSVDVKKSFNIESVQVFLSRVILQKALVFKYRNDHKTLHLSAREHLNSIGKSQSIMEKCYFYLKTGMFYCYARM